MATSVKILSLNIEGDKHLDLVIPFIRKEKPDVVCLQEVMEVDLPLFEKAVFGKGHFAPMINLGQENIQWIKARGLMGVGIFTRLEIIEVKEDIYVGNPHNIPEFSDGTRVIPNRVVLSVKVKKDNETFVFTVTHFTRTDDGESTEEQIGDLKKLLNVLDKDTVLCGDFNAPRGKKTWDMLSREFKDNIPDNIKTTLDDEIHIKPGLNFVVDGLFTGKSYYAKNVRVICGVSDHCAVVGEISRK
jgi:endonuclease/exonuclease/phosphatase family metal-dependent hydrolase